MSSGPSVYDTFIDFEFTSENCPGWTQEQIDAANRRNAGDLGNQKKENKSHGNRIDYGNTLGGGMSL